MSKFKPKKKTQDRYLYISPEDKKKLLEKKEKYKLSLSCIIRVINETLNFYSSKDKIYNEKTQATKNILHIKPSGKNGIHESNIIQLSNCVHHYLTKCAELDINQEQKNKIMQLINKDLQKEKDNFWNLNTIIRTNKRALKILGATKQWELKHV